MSYKKHGCFKHENMDKNKLILQESQINIGIFYLFNPGFLIWLNRYGSKEKTKFQLITSKIRQKKETVTWMVNRVIHI